LAERGRETLNLRSTRKPNDRRDDDRGEAGSKQHRQEEFSPWGYGGRWLRNERLQPLRILQYCQSIPQPFRFGIRARVCLILPSPAPEAPRLGFPYGRFTPARKPLLGLFAHVLVDVPGHDALLQRSTIVVAYQRPALADSDCEMLLDRLDRDRTAL